MSVLIFFKYSRHFAIYLIFEQEMVESYLTRANPNLERFYLKRFKFKEGYKRSRNPNSYKIPTPVGFSWRGKTYAFDKPVDSVNWNHLQIWIIRFSSQKKSLVVYFFVLQTRRFSLSLILACGLIEIRIITIIKFRLISARVIVIKLLLFVSGTKFAFLFFSERGRNHAIKIFVSGVASVVSVIDHP